MYIKSLQEQSLLLINLANGKIVNGLNIYIAVLVCCLVMVKIQILDFL